MLHKELIRISLNKLRIILQNKNLYIWGAGNQGRGIARILHENGIIPSGYIDNSYDMSGQSIAGIRVESPSIISEIPEGKLFIIISVFFYEQEISDTCQKYGLKQGEDFIHYSSLKPRDYSIDISGSCNLKCISCPRASKTKNSPSVKLMPLEAFCKIIDKIKVEDPFVGNIQLYQWGEPTLNNKLPEMIRYARENHIYSAVSSNLNLKVNYQKIIESRPEWFRISASGWGKQYEIAHTGGDWDVFINNLKQVALLRQTYYPEMKLELYYHLYKHSTGKSLLKFQNLCKKLSIEFHPVYAYLISLDDVLRYQEGIPLPPSAQKAQKKMLLNLDEGIRIAQNEIALPCDAFRSIHINSDLSVSNCMMFFYPDKNRAVDNFLETSIDSIMNIRRDCDLCKRCIKHAIHRYCGSYSTLKPDIKN